MEARAHRIALARAVLFAHGMSQPRSEVSLATVTMAVILVTTLSVGLIMVMVVLLRA